MLFVGVEGVGRSQLSGDTGRQLEARREAHQLGFNQQCVLRIQQSQQLSAPRGIHVPPQILMGVFDLLGQLWIQQMLGETLKVGVLTGHSLLLQKKHLEAVGADIEKLVIQGMETQPHFCRVVIEGEDKQDYNKMLHDVLDAVEQMLHRCDVIGAILLECSNLTTFAREVAEHFDMPVFDVNMAIRMLYRSRRSDCYRAENIPKI